MDRHSSRLQLSLANARKAMHGLSDAGKKKYLVKETIAKVKIITQEKPRLKKGIDKAKHEKRLAAWKENQAISLGWMNGMGISRQRARQLYKDALWNPGSKAYLKDGPARKKRMRSFNTNWPEVKN